MLLTGFHVVPAMASVPPMIAQFIGVEHSILNEAGEPLVGTNPYAHEFDIPVVEGALVQILMVTDASFFIESQHMNRSFCRFCEACRRSEVVYLGTTPDTQ